MTNCKSRIRIGDIFLVDLNGCYNEQNGTRPVVVIQNNTGNSYSPNIIVVPFTSCIKKQHMPTHVFIDSQKTGIEKDSIALCENPITISKKRIVKYITSMPEEYMIKIAYASLISVGVLQYLDDDMISSVKEDLKFLNMAS